MRGFHVFVAVTRVVVPFRRDVRARILGSVIGIDARIPACQAQVELTALQDAAFPNRGKEHVAGIVLDVGDNAGLMQHLLKLDAVLTPRHVAVVADHRERKRLAVFHHDTIGGARLVAVVGQLFARGRNVGRILLNVRIE